MAVGDNYDIYSFNYLMEKALSNIPDTLDKRQGSVIYDALAPACYELAEFYMQLKDLLKNTYLETATGEYLDLRVVEQNIQRYPASYATKQGTFLDSLGAPIAIPIGSRFSTISNSSSLNYAVTELITPGNYKLVCETLGTAGNSYTGNLLPLSNIPGLQSSTMSTLLVPARDEETDDELKTRYLETINEKPFGGNIAQYDYEIKSIEGVGSCRVYPTWNGGGTVKCSVIDAQFNRLTPEFIATIQELIDPQAIPGGGLGIAPIGHQVTIVTPSNLTINVAATVTLAAGVTIGQIQSAVEDAIYDYLLSLREEWGTESDMATYSLAVYLSRINVAILSVSGINNVVGTTLNGAALDITLLENSTTQQLPVLGTVVLSE